MLEKQENLGRVISENKFRLFHLQSSINILIFGHSLHCSPGKHQPPIRIARLVCQWPENDVCIMDDSMV
jgi:hypothetical protein